LYPQPGFQTEIGNSLLEVKVDSAELEKRDKVVPDLSSQFSMGRQIFAALRTNLTGAEQGASAIFTGEKLGSLQ
jgi:phosphogluconate dehydratase